MGNLQQALLDCEAAFSRTSANKADAYRTRGIIFMKMNRVEEAVLDFKHAFAASNSESSIVSIIEFENYYSFNHFQCSSSN